MLKFKHSLCTVRFIDQFPQYIFIFKEKNLTEITSYLPNASFICDVHLEHINYKINAQENVFGFNNNEHYKNHKF